MTVLIFFVLIGFVFWLASLGGKKDWEPQPAAPEPDAPAALEAAS